MPSAGPEHDFQVPREPYCRSAHSTVYYYPRRQADHGRRLDPDHFPAALIQPRQRRPHSIHIVSYPPGFVPPDLRLPKTSRGTAARQEKRKRRKREKEEAKQRKKGEKERERQEKERRRADKENSEKQQKRRSLRSLSSGSGRFGRVVDKIAAAFSITPKPPSAVSARPTGNTPRSRPSSFISFAWRLSRLEPATSEPILAGEPDPEPASMTAVTVPRPQAAITTAVMPANRNTIMSIRSSKSMMRSSACEVQKPVASGSGVSCSILLAEPNVFLSGFDHDRHTRRSIQSTSALLRGKLQLNVSKNVKIKSITLRLVGKARTEWPEGIPPSKSEVFEETTLRAQSLVFFHAMHEGMWDTEYGSQCTYTLENASPMGSRHSTVTSGSLPIPGKGRGSTLTAKELKRLSLQSVNSRSFGKADSPHINHVHAKGYKIFRPGTYEYSFELPIDHSQLETARLPFGSVRWDLEMTVERAGAFKPNLHGSREVSIVRLPDQMSLEAVEPISISRLWEDQLHYDIVISGKSFPIGAKIPIAFKLTPLAKVQVHRIRVFVTENIEYWTNDRRVTRKDAGRKILLLEKAAGKPLDERFSASDVRVVFGGELSPEQREEARMTAARRRMRDASWNRGSPEPLPEPSDNLLGDLDLGLESFWGSTEIEMNVQLPTCDMMARDKLLRLHPDCSWKNVNVFHWIKVVMRISRSDSDDPTGKRRRHFEISIDSPFTVLNCRATQANTALPRYSGSGAPVIPEQRQQMSCGCPDAQPLDPSAAALARPLTLVEEDFINASGRRLCFDGSASLPSVPLAAHRPSGRQTVSSSDARPETLFTPTERDRPIHLLRYPSHNPPAFDADEPPPPLPMQTPPPQYDLIVGTPSVDGLADYFARLAAYEGNGAAGACPGREEQAADRVESVSDVDTVGPDTDNPGGEATRPSTASTAPPPVLPQQPSPAGAVADWHADTSTGTVGDEVDPFKNLSMDSSDQASGTPPTEAPAPAPTLAPAPAPCPGSGGGGDGGDDAADAESSGSEDSIDEEHGRARLHRGGRVNVANPRTPGGRLVPSRSLEIERPTVRLDMTNVLRRRADRA
ncbi:hypothetical protein L209DRAFT_682158 [Thermothelomyces heterothallicus CBS 203.75]